MTKWYSPSLNFSSPFGIEMFLRVTDHTRRPSGQIQSVTGYTRCGTISGTEMYVQRVRNKRYRQLCAHTMRCIVERSSWWQLISIKVTACCGWGKFRQWFLAWFYAWRNWGRHAGSCFWFCLLCSAECSHKWQTEELFVGDWCNGWMQWTEKRTSCD